MANQQIIIGLVGETGSGKDTVGNFCQKKFGAVQLRFIDPVKEALQLISDQPSKQDQQWLALEFKKYFGKNILCRILQRKIEKLSGKIIIINGLRFMEDFDFVKSFPKSFVIYITADQKIRWQRVNSRGEKTDDQASFKKFQAIEKAKTELAIPRIGKKADFVIKNDKDLKTLLRLAQEAMEKILKV